MTSVSVRELLECGAHFGHQTRRWNPKMKKYIFGQRNGIYIIDLQKTARLAKKAFQFVFETAANGGKILFVGTKRQAEEVIAAEAQRCDCYYVDNRWLGGLMTNFTTIQQSIQRLKDLEARLAEPSRLRGLKKKEIGRLEKERARLDKALHGIKEMKRLPEILFVVDVVKERIAILEAIKLGIPIIAIVDTNCDPDGIEYIIPANDDAIRSIQLFSSRVADAVMEGGKLFEQRRAEEEARKAEERTRVEAQRKAEAEKRKLREQEIAKAAAERAAKLKAKEEADKEALEARKPSGEEDAPQPSEEAAEAAAAKVTPGAKAPSRAKPKAKKAEAKPDKQEEKPAAKPKPAAAVEKKAKPVEADEKKAAKTEKAAAKPAAGKMPAAKPDKSEAEKDKKKETRKVGAKAAKSEGKAETTTKKPAKPAAKKEAAKKAAPKAEKKSDKAEDAKDAKGKTSSDAKKKT